MRFRLVPKSLTLNDLERRGRYFALDTKCITLESQLCQTGCN